MKSEKAKQFIDNGVIQMHNGDRMVDASTAYTALELAELEAEERMREKAIEAYRRSCSCGESTCNSCALMRRFTQKLTE